MLRQVIFNAESLPSKRNFGLSRNIGNREKYMLTREAFLDSKRCLMFNIHNFLGLSVV